MQRVHSMASAGFLQALAAKVVAGETSGPQHAKHDTVQEGESSDSGGDEPVEQVQLEYVPISESSSVLPTKMHVASTGADSRSDVTKPTHGRQLTSHETLDNGVQIFTYDASGHSKSSAGKPGASQRQINASHSQPRSPARSRHAAEVQQLGSPSTVDTASSYEDSPGSKHSGSAIASSVKSFRTVSSSRSQPRSRRNYTFREY